MADLVLTPLRFTAGFWDGLLTGGDGAAPPALRVTHDGAAVPGVRVERRAEGDGWTVRVPIPAEAVGDGVRTLLIAEADGTVLERIVLSGGAALAEDMRAEIALLRAELDLLKAAFRRQCRAQATDTP